MYENVANLAKALNRTVVAFDLEHTGGSCRRITEFGAVVVTPEGKTASFGSLVQPGEGAVFMPFVTRLTGIKPDTVKDAPTWDVIFKSFVQGYSDAIWFGFNSNTCDMPIVRKESQRYGFDASVINHVDLMRFGNLGGSLTERLSKLWPSLSTEGAHRAEKDAEFTMLLLAGLLKTVNFAELIQANRICITQNVPKPGQSANKKPAEALKPDMSFLCKNGETRQGSPWLESERLWAISMFNKGKSFDSIATLNGRSPYAIACKLHLEGLIEKPERSSFTTATI